MPSSRRNASVTLSSPGRVRVNSGARFPTSGPTARSDDGARVASGVAGVVGEGLGGEGIGDNTTPAVSGVGAAAGVFTGPMAVVGAGPAVAAGVAVAESGAAAACPLALGVLSAAAPVGVAGGIVAVAPQPIAAMARAIPIAAGSLLRPRSREWFMDGDESVEHTSLWIRSSLLDTLFLL